MKKLESIKSLKNRAGKLWKECAFKRDGKSCKVKERFPNLEIFHSNVIQVDHCITRANKHFFFDTRNSLVVCSACNMLKSMQAKSVHRLIDQIVIEREGQDIFDEFKALDMRKSPNVNFSKRWWLEDIIDKLELEKGKEAKTSFPKSLF